MSKLEPDELEAAKKHAARLIGGRDYSRNELVEKLKEKHSAEAAEEAAEIMCRYGYIDDTRYAEKLAAKYITVRGYGKRKASVMMRQKLLDAETVEAALAKYTPEDISAEITEILRKKYYDRLFLGGDEGKKEMQRIIAALARRGYGYNDIKAALRIIRAELDEWEE